ncbi:MAG: 2'-5' RNA ligase [Shewanella sp.]|jgi:2'-5' RNA ligase
MTEKRVFLGFSLTPQQTLQIEAIQLQLPLSVRLVPRDNLHMTLAFLGQASNETIDVLINSVDAINKPRFKVRLDLIEHWQKPKILCLKGAASDPNLMALANTAQLLAQQLSLHQSEHHYNPHITLSRKATAAVSDVTYQPLLLQPTTLHLFQSFAGADGVEYPILHSWPLV